MNVITQIESALKAIDQATFQNLINHLLYLQGNKFIGAPGAVVGKNKTSKGSPDSFFIHDEKYIFVECTTKERLGASKAFFEKLLKDIDHCFNEAETTIQAEKIETVILACNEKINPEEDSQLRNAVRAHNATTKFELLNIQNLPFMLFDFGKLAEEYLNVVIVKGDIFTLREFLIKTQQGLQPSLTNVFLGREDELRKCTDSLARIDRLVLTGAAGVGKSKIAVELLQQHELLGFIPIVIQSSAVPLWDDFQHVFRPNEKYIVLFDDANKSIVNLQYLLSVIDRPKLYSIKVVITSRDYVKKQVLTTLEEQPYEEIAISAFSDEQIGKIIVAALPGLKYHFEIKRKIIELAKGNARVALMATYSVTPDSDVNYLSSPVLLYEKYFKKISAEVGIFADPIVLKSLAIVSFFGVLDRKNEELKQTLSTVFSIDWNSMWSAIIELHRHEIMDVHADEVVRISDQVLATYAFYKCFIDSGSSVINYAEWILTFIGDYGYRISATLIDVNNTFDYTHVIALVLPHLDVVINNFDSEDQLYSFYEHFWFYKGLDCLAYLRRWVASVPQEPQPERLEFSYGHNDHSKASKHFDLLKNFWDHSDRLLQPSIELALDLVVRQPKRLPEVLKFFHDIFQFKRVDYDSKFFRQNKLLDTLTSDQLPESKKIFANGIFFEIADALLGWHYTEYGSAKARGFTIYNFDLVKSVDLMYLRSRILNHFNKLFDSKNSKIQKVLRKIVQPGGDIDVKIYVEEIPLYNQLITKKFDYTQYEHCRFVNDLSNRIKKARVNPPDQWKTFTESEIMRLARFIRPTWDYSDDKSFEESTKEKQQEFRDFVNSRTWNEIEEFLFKIDGLYRQKTDENSWHIETAMTELYILLAQKDKSQLIHALRLFCSEKVSYPLRTSLMTYILESGIMSGQEVLEIMNEYEFSNKPYWETVLLAMLPADQVNEKFLQLLLKSFQKRDAHIYLFRMLDYVRYETVFDLYKKSRKDLEKHNIITYLTHLLFTGTPNARNQFGVEFFKDCKSFFSQHLPLLKSIYWSQFKADVHFDHNGKQISEILDIDKFFINQSLKNSVIGVGFSSTIRLERVNTNKLWDFEDHAFLVEDLLLTVIDKADFISFAEADINSIFTFKYADADRTDKVQNFLLQVTKKYYQDEKLISIILTVVYSCYQNWFVPYLKELVLLNKDPSLVSKMNFSRSESWSGSRVPVIQKKIDFYQSILEMLNSLPDILDYTEHIKFFEKAIVWKKKEIQEEQRQDFMEEFH